MVQAVVGLIITITLGYTLCPGLFKAAGILLPMGYGQGPGQANNVGTSYQALGFVGGHSFGLALAAAGYICACVVGVIMLNFIVKKRNVSTATKLSDDDLTVGFFQDKNELPVADSIDRLSMQVCMVLATYFVTYLIIHGLTSGISALSESLAKTLNTLIWGFNFIVASGVAILLRVILEKGRALGVFRRQYQNNYLLNRISGFFFDLMIVAGVSAIEINDIKNYILPVVILSVVGAIVTYIYIRLVSKECFKGFDHELFLMGYGTLTGTASNGMILMKEIDPSLRTPTSSLYILSNFPAMVMIAPLLFLLSFAGKSFTNAIIAFAIFFVLWVVYTVFLFRRRIFKKHYADKPVDEWKDEE
jgi:ESS family glutamate:Na+ symporter